MDSQEAKALLQKYQSGNCTSSEIEWVEIWYKQLVDTGDLIWEEGEKDFLQEDLENRIMLQLKISPKKEKKGLFVLSRSMWWAAAAVTFLLGFFTYSLFINQSPDLSGVAKNIPVDIQAPESNKAVITLSNGQKIFLDSVDNNVSTIQGNAELVRMAGGKIVYKKGTGADEEIQFNTLFNPKGSKVVNIILADGSQVWLNSGSTLTYPVLFVDAKRKVSIDGEAYFDIAPDASKPFIVQNGTMDVQVLGTQFNVNTFEDDDSNIKVTLLEGAVKIFNGNATNFLKPGQQALIKTEIKVLNNVDVNKVMAWKNGYFHFDKASLQSVLKQISRWYDVEVVYEGRNQTRGFVGEMERDLSLPEVLKILEMNKVQFKIVGKKLIIEPD